MKKALAATARLASLCALLSMTSVDQPKEILLWPNGAPGSEGKIIRENVRVTAQGEHVVSSIHAPSLTPYIPSPTLSTGTAIIIAPGGGHKELWIDHEGYNPAKWFMERGVAAFVLKYRLAKEDNSTYSVDAHALIDMQRAIRYVRSHAAEWNIDPNKIGVMGFSAGGEVAALSAMRFDGGKATSADIIDQQPCRPDFQALVYPGNSSRYEVTENMPPVFIVCGYNDRDDISLGMAQLYEKYKAAKVSAELHIYAKPGHGFGMRDQNSGAVTGWPTRLEEWMKDIGFLRRP